MLLVTGDPQILQLQKKTERTLGKCPSGTSGGGMNPVPVLQQQLDAPRAQESRTTGDADGSRGRKGRLHGTRDEPKQALHAARRMAGAKKLLVVENFRGIPGDLVYLQSLGPRSIIFGATRSWWIGTPALGIKTLN